MDFKTLTQGERIVLIAGALLVLDLLILPWHNIDLAGLISVKRTGVQSPNSFYGVLALIVTIVIIGLVVAKLANAKLPDLPVPLSQIIMIGAIVVLALLLLKLIVETDFLGVGAYLGVLLGAAVAFGGFTVRKEAGATGGLSGLGR